MKFKNGVKKSNKTCKKIYKNEICKKISEVSFEASSGILEDKDEKKSHKPLF